MAQESQNSGILGRGINFVSRLWGSGAAPSQESSPSAELAAEPSGEVVSLEGCLRIAICSPKRLEFYSTLSPTRLFTVLGSLTGPLGRFTKNIPSRGKEVTLTVPLRLPEGQESTAKVVLHASRQDPEGLKSAKLLRAGLGSQPQGGQIISVLLGRERDEFQYIFEFDKDTQIVDFEEVVDNRPVFQNVPPIAQMSTFLRAITSQRRNVQSILRGLQAVASSELAAATRQFLRLYREGLTIDESPALELKQHFIQAGKNISEQVLIAFPIFLELAAGNLDPSELSAQDTIQISPVALSIVSSHFGLPLKEEDWQKLSFSAQLNYEDLQSLLATPQYYSLPQRLRNNWDNRSPIAILEQLAVDSDSRRVTAFSQALRKIHSGHGLIINDQQMSLLALLSAVGRRYHPNTVAALCMFVDAELGVIDADSLSEADKNYCLETSAYAMLVVGGAFDVSLSSLALELGPGQRMDIVFPKLVEFTGIGLLSNFQRRDGSRTWLWIPNAQTAGKALRMPQQTFDGVVLGSLPKIEQLSEIDLADMLESGRDFIASFQSDFDKTVIWRRISSIPPEKFMINPKEGERRTSFSFIEGFCAYHFSKAVLGHTFKVHDEELIGQENVLAIFLDDRENAHYVYLPSVESVDSLQPPPNTGWTWSHQIVLDYDMRLLPQTMRELGLDYLLGRPEPTSPKYKRLNWLHDAVWNIFAQPSPHQSLSDRPDILERIYKKLWSPEGRSLISGLMDARTQEILGKVLRGSSRERLDFSPHACLLQGSGQEDQLELLALQVLLAMSRCSYIEFGSYVKMVDEVGFRNLIEDRILTLAHSEVPEKELIACQLLSSAEFATDPKGRFIAQEELRHILDHTDDQNVGVAACEGLVRLSLERKVPLPNLVRITPLQTDARQVQPTAGLNPLRQSICEWLEQLRQRNPREYLSLPIVEANGQIDAQRLQAFVEFLGAVDEACRDNYGQLPRHYLAIASERQIEDTLVALLECWKLLARSRHQTLSEMLAHTQLSVLFVDYRFFIEDHSQEIERRLGRSPYFGGQTTPLKIYHFRPQEKLGPYCAGPPSPLGRSRRQESEFFKDLLFQFFESPEKAPRILRLHSASGMKMEQIEQTLPTFKTSRIVDVRFVEAFSPQRGTFVPLLNDVTYVVERMGGNSEELNGIYSLLRILTGNKGPKPEEPNPAANAAKSAPSPETESKPPRWESSEEEEALPASAGPEEDQFNELMQMADTARQAVDLPNELQRQVLNIFISATRFFKPRS